MHTFAVRSMRWFTRLPHWQMAVFVCVLVGSGVFLVVAPSHAALAPLEKEVAQLIGAIIAWFGWIITQVLLMAVNVLIKVAGYNEFVTSPAVERGWVIVRDLTNMFFIVVMLVIAFGTVLGLEEYGYKRMLPRLLIMAVVINFSKLICGLMIDFSQVVMITFVDGFSAIAAGNFLTLFAVVPAITPNADAVTQAVQTRSEIWAATGSLLLGAIMMLISVTCVAILTLMLVFRIVMLWLLVVLSPLAFFLSAFPKGKAASAYGKWWELFGNYVVVGPFVAFFLWLSLAVAGTGSLAATQGLIESGTTTGADSISLFTSQAGTTPILISFIIGTAMLLGGMTLAAQFGTAGGSMMASTAQWFQQKGKAAALSPLLGARWAGAKAGGAAKSVVGSYAQLADAKIAKATGVHLDPRFYTRGLQAGMKARIADAEGAAAKANQARIQRGDAASGFYALVSDPEGAARVGLVNTATKGVRTFANTPMGWETYATFADERRQRIVANEKQQKEARASGANVLREEFVESQQLAQDPNASAQEQGAARGRVDAIGDMVSRLEKGEQLTQSDRDWLKQTRDAAPQGSETRERMEKILGEETHVDMLASDSARLRGEEQKYTELAVRSQAAFGKQLAEPAKHGMSGMELASRYKVAKEQGDTEAMLRYYKWAGVNGEMDDFAKELEVSVSGSDLDKLKAVSLKVQAETKTSGSTMGEVNDEISSSNKGKDQRYSNTVVTGAGGLKRFASEDEKQAADAKDWTKGDNFGNQAKKGLMKQVATEDSQGNLTFTPAGLYGFVSNLDKVIARAQKNQLSADDVEKMLRKFDSIKKQVITVTPQVNQKGVIDKLDELQTALNKHTKAGSFSDFLRKLREQQNPARPITVNVKGGGGSSGGSSGGSAPGSPPPARPTRPTTSAPPATPPRPVGTNPTGSSVGGTVPPPTTPTP